VLRRGNLYATAAIAGTAIYVALEALGVRRPIPSFAGMTVIAGVRLASILWGLQLPVFELDSTAAKR
jgi:uncharacterized membrane protein YeiH